MGGVGLGQLQAPLSPLPGRAKPTHVRSLLPHGTAAPGRRGDTARGAHTTGGGSEHGLGSQPPPAAPHSSSCSFFIF